LVGHGKGLEKGFWMGFGCEIGLEECVNEGLMNIMRRRLDFPS
jgi:hypothetical protein